MGRGGKAAHVQPDFGEDDLCTQAFDARSSDQSFDGGAKGLNVGLHLSIDGSDRIVEGIDLPEMKAKQKAMVLADAAAQGLPQFGWGGFQPTIGQECELGRVGLTGNQRLDHRPAALTHDVGDHRIQLDVGVFERLLDAQNVARLLTNQLLARAQ